MSLSNASGYLKQDIEYVGIAWTTALIITSFLALDKCCSFQPWFTNSAESSRTRLSHNRNSPYRSDTNTRNADYIISDVNRSESVDIVRVRTV
ncbi:unnamed protein product [Coffea canephora]|uniref:Uncharacterized protein n=1 Tax=Coffea canephora TaxID=49390 RepID=A0A068UCK8_COFCA|nr:unnamed protein product [Coffea canephora]